MNSIPRLRLLVGVCLTNLVAASHAQNFLFNEEFNDPGLPGWEVYGESSSAFYWNVEDGSINTLGHGFGEGTWIGASFRKMGTETGIGPTEWTLQTRFYLPQSSGRYSSSFIFFPGNQNQFLNLLTFGKNAANTSGEISVNLGSGQTYSQFVGLDSWFDVTVSVTAAVTELRINGLLASILTSPINTQMGKFEMGLSSQQTLFGTNRPRMDYVRLVPEPATVTTLIALLIGTLRKKR